MSFLPAPKHKYEVLVDDEVGRKDSDNTRQMKMIPPLLSRQGFIPSSLDDFGDGGAFPEIHVVQYPLNMGRPGVKSTAVVSVDVDDKGEVKFDAIVKQGSNKNKIVQSTFADVKEKEGDHGALALPAEDEEAQTAEKTRLALQSLLDSKIKKAKPTTLANSRREAIKDEPTYVRYTPNPNAPGVGDGGKERVIRMVEAQVDPMEPPKHKFKKVARGPPSPPAPVLHSPPRKLTVADQASWKIPPCISNWKNARGYTIPLDKRLAADGRGLQESTINNKFASLTEALYVVERKAAEDIKVRNQVRKQMAMKEKEDSEKELREMAARARLERSTGAVGGAVAAPEDARDYYRQTSSAADGASVEIDRESKYETDRRLDDETEAERVARQQREDLRVQRRKEHAREARLENVKGRRGDKQDRDAGRDISEKIALGVLKGSGSTTGEGLFDSRLFNQSSGMDSGFGAEDDYNTYSKPLFARGEVANSIYRPRASDSDTYGDADEQLEKLQAGTSKFKADKGFRGTEAYASAGPRSEPVQFERGSSSAAGDSREKDPVYDRHRGRYDSDSDDEGVDRKRLRH